MKLIFNFGYIFAENAWDLYAGGSKTNKELTAELTYMDLVNTEDSNYEKHFFDKSNWALKIKPISQNFNINT